MSTSAGSRSACGCTQSAVVWLIIGLASPEHITLFKTLLFTVSDSNLYHRMLFSRYFLKTALLTCY